MFSFLFQVKPEALAKVELADCRRHLLKAQSAQAWAECTVAFNQRRIKELELYFTASAPKVSPTPLAVVSGMSDTPLPKLQTKETYVK